MPDCSRLPSHIPLVGAWHFRGYQRAPCLVARGAARVNGQPGSWEIAGDDGINNCDLPLCYSCHEGGQRCRSRWPLVSLRAGLLLASPRANCPRGRMEQGSSWKCRNTHRIYNRKRHTYTQDRHTQYDILFPYQAASVSWSSRRPTSCTEPGQRSTVCAAQTSCWYKCSSSSSGSEGNPGPLVYISSLQLL